MVKRCCWGTCNSDSRYPDRINGVRFIPFPKPVSHPERCRLWIKLCGRPYHQLNPLNIKNSTYICTKHFIEGKPTIRFPHPVDASDPDAALLCRSPFRDRCKAPLPDVEKKKTPNRDETKDSSKRSECEKVTVARNRSKKVKNTKSPGKKKTTQNITALSEKTNSKPPRKTPGRKRLRCEQPPPNMNKKQIKQEETDSISENTECQEDMLSGENCKSEKVGQKENPEEDKITHLEQQNAELRQEIDSLKKKIMVLQSPMQQTTPESLQYCGVPNYFFYCTGFNYQQFNSLCTIFNIPNSDSVLDEKLPFICQREDHQIAPMPVRQQFLMVLMKLRQDFDFRDLAYRFQIEVESVKTLFTSWIAYMFSTLTDGTTWPHRDVISEQMPPIYKLKFPTTFAMFACTELEIEKKSYENVQSQRKSTNTMKSLLAVDPQGAVLYVSSLFPGPVSDLEVFRRCDIVLLLKGLLECGYLNVGDGLMADTNFSIERELEELGLKLNIPPFVNSKQPASLGGVQNTIAQQRRHVERSISKIKEFKIVSGKISNSTLSNINEIWYVVSMLSNIQSGIIR